MLDQNDPFRQTPQRGSGSKVNDLLREKFFFFRIINVAHKKPMHRTHDVIKKIFLHAFSAKLEADLSG